MSGDDQDPLGHGPTASAGAAADSALADAELAKLPRLLRYAVVALNQDVSSRIVADVADVAPELVPVVAAWSEGGRVNSRDIAVLLDQHAASDDKPVLRTIADGIRLASLCIPIQSGVIAERWQGGSVRRLRRFVDVIVRARDPDARRH